MDDVGPFATWIVSGATPFVPEDAPLLATDAPRVVRERAPDLAAAFDARGLGLPPRIDRVYDPGRAARELGWRARFGWRDVLATFDAGVAEVLPPIARR